MPQVREVKKNLTFLQSSVDRVEWGALEDEKDELSHVVDSEFYPDGIGKWQDRSKSSTNRTTPLLIFHPSLIT